MKGLWFVFFFSKMYVFSWAKGEMLGKVLHCFARNSDAQTDPKWRYPSKTILKWEYVKVFLKNCSQGSSSWLLFNNTLQRNIC